MADRTDEHRALQAMAAKRDDAQTDDDEPQLDPDPYYPTMQKQTTEPPADEEEDEG
jgi:hypothetical protein